MVFCRGLALVFFAFAVVQWITYDYPDVNPFFPGAILAPGMFGQFLNYLIVVALGTIGFLLWQAPNIWRRDRSD